MKYLLPLYVLSFLLLFSFELLPPESNSFQLSLFKKVSESNPNSNVILSPLSAYQALSLVSNGARGETQSNIVNTLGYKNQIEVNVDNQKIIEAVEEEKELKIANAVLTTFTPNESFIQIANKYKALSSKLISAQQVNQWCAEKTENKITKIIDSIEGIKMIVLNAIYFKSKWLKEFRQQNTQKYDFTNEDKSKKKIDMMFQKESFPYGATNEYQAIELPYKDTKMSAVVILPSANIDMNTFVNSLDDDKLYDIIHSMNRSTVHFRLPKFELEFSTSLKNALIDMGMKEAFDPSSADFTAVTDHMRLYIDEIIQKAYMKVDEEGTEAAAVTAIISRATCIMPPREPIVMNVDRPFLFLIRNIEFGDKLVFMAKIGKLN